ncbi:Uncharacterised protein [Vibrio cholerae]|nr:Uncharacterised protein [Vibrio cholerae]CSB79265.1 Uncharacterised protein [Vibrio cholerae]
MWCWRLAGHLRCISTPLTLMFLLVMALPWRGVRAAVWPT